MTGEHRKAHARRIVTGLNKVGLSTVVSDAVTSTRLVTDAYTLNQIWQATTAHPVMA